MGFKYLINTGPTCDVTIFVKGAQNAQFSFRIFPGDFQDFEISYLGNRNRYQQKVKSLFSQFLMVFHISQKNYQNFRCIGTLILGNNKRKYLF